MSAPRREWPDLIMLRGMSSREGLPIDRMLRRCGSPRSALRAGPAVWEEECGFIPESERLGMEARRRAEAAARKLEELRAVVLDLRGSDYPEALRFLPRPPPVLFARGRLELLARPGIAVVGTRAASTYGRDATAALTAGLVGVGYTIISGLARGIDSIAHRSALDLGGDTVAVLGTGLDVAYPPENREMIEELAEGGCILSEFPPGTPPRKHHFPQRNRLIAGLARAVLVVEAGERSGALITAEYALEEGKEVFAVPGPIHNEGSQGTHRLIRDGAALATCAADIVETMRARTGEPLPLMFVPGGEGAGETSGPRPAANASCLAMAIWSELERGASDTDALAAAVGSDPAGLYGALLELELSGLIERMPGPRYRRTVPKGP